MVPILCLLAVIVLSGTVLGYLLYYHSKKRDLKRWRDNRNRAPQPDFSALERDDQTVPLVLAEATDDAASFDRYGDDSDLIYADPVHDRLSPIGRELFSTDEAPEYTSVVEPSPIFGTRVTVRQSCMRAARHMERCAEAVHERHDFAEAEAFAMAALREIDGSMKRDHWYAPFVLNWLGYLRYEQGFAVEASEYWERAEQGALEWFEQCHELLQEIRRNLRFFRNNFYGCGD